MLLRTQVDDDATQASPARKLTDKQHNKLAPASHLSQFLPTMVLFDQRFEFMSIHQREELGKNCVTMRNGLILPCFMMFARTFIVSTGRELSLFCVKLWDSSDIHYNIPIAGRGAFG